MTATAVKTAPTTATPVALTVSNSARMPPWMSRLPAPPPGGFGGGVCSRTMGAGAGPSVGAASAAPGSASHRTARTRPTSASSDSRGRRR